MSAQKWTDLGFILFSLYKPKDNKKGCTIYLHYTAIAGVHPHQDYSSISLKNGQCYDVKALGYEICDQLYKMAKEVDN